MFRLQYFNGEAFISIRDEVPLWAPATKYRLIDGLSVQHDSFGDLPRAPRLPAHNESSECQCVIRRCMRSIHPIISGIRANIAIKQIVNSTTRRTRRQLKFYNWK